MITKQPHDSWAIFYDFVYQKTFGNFYNSLTDETLKVINNILPNGTIIDFGAGTGRLTIPLKNQGYEIIAVEKSNGMVEELKNKCSQRNLEIPVFNCSISEYKNGKADLGVALFTVLSYSITEEELSNNIKTICRHIKPNGYFFFDLPGTVFFNAGRLINIQSVDFNRSVELTNINESNIYTYKETCSGSFNGEAFSYEDEFSIRYWDFTTLDTLLIQNGFIATNKVFSQFNSTGATYNLYHKI